MRIFFVVLTFVAGLATGWFLAPPDKGEATIEPGAGVQKPAQRDRAPLPEAPQGEGGVPSAVAPGDITQKLEVAFLSGRVDYTALKELMAALTELSPATLSEFTDFFSKRSLTKPQIMLWQMFFAAWGDFDGPGAIAFIDGRFDDANTRRLFYAAVIGTWKNGSIEDSLAFALKSFDGSNGAFDSHLAMEYLRSLAERDPDAALALATSFNDGELVLELTARRISELAEKDREAALQAVESLTGEARTFAAAQFYIDWAKQDPQGAAAWLSEHFSPDLGTHTLVQVGAEFLRADPGAAGLWIAQLPDAEIRETVLAGAVKAWAMVDAAAAAEWLKGAGANPEHDDAFVVLGDQLSKQNPRAVVEEFVPMISDPQKGNELLSEVSLAWQRDNPAEFSQWLEGAPAISAETKQRLLARETPGADAAADVPAAGAGEGEVDQGRGEF